MQSQLCLITGANSGIGRITALELAKKGFDILMLCRNLDKARPVRQEIKAVSQTKRVDLIQCDLASQESVVQAAREVIDRYDHLDVLLNNAGLFIDKQAFSPEGIELTFATNHLGPFLLTNLLLDLLKKGQQSRVVTVSSEAHRWNRGFHLNEMARPRSYSGMNTYGASKLCNILFAKELANRLMNDGITSNSLHPGAVNTNFGVGAVSLQGLAFKLMKPFFISPEKGAQTSIYLASSPEVNKVTGLYFDKCRPKTPNSDAQSDFNAKKLWELSEQLTHLKERTALVKV
ncbi:SDR family oxidoreductase [Tellurirhabdus rosea]|uniref:SDR family oxidoreductase n=1 Tax=Tellurirhabdus rosea TaxID=2674997 RepID=UPI0022504C3D|nr:SDR family oxidoreductase [Tellurirhabdus rosea]